MTQAEMIAEIKSLREEVKSLRKDVDMFLKMRERIIAYGNMSDVEKHLEAHRLERDGL